MPNRRSTPRYAVVTGSNRQQVPIVLGLDQEIADRLAKQMGFDVVPDEGQFEGKDALSAIAALVDSLEASQRQAAEENRVVRPTRVAPMGPSHSRPRWKRG